jgi:hypothetical protein
MVNDRYFDLAVAADLVVTSGADEGIYLEQYFGQRPDDYQRARYFLMRQVIHMFSATIFLLLGVEGVRARGHWEQLLENVRGARFDEALGIVGERNSSGDVRLLLPSAP